VPLPVLPLMQPPPVLLVEVAVVVPVAAVAVPVAIELPVLAFVPPVAMDVPDEVALADPPEDVVPLVVLPFDAHAATPTTTVSAPTPTMLHRVRKLIPPRIRWPGLASTDRACEARGVRGGLPRVRQCTHCSFETGRRAVRGRGGVRVAGSAFACVSASRQPIEPFEWRGLVRARHVEPGSSLALSCATD